jgi:hypothetical protein
MTGSGVKLVARRKRTSDLRANEQNTLLVSTRSTTSASLKGWGSAGKRTKPAAGQRMACWPFGVAAGSDALGPEVARRVRCEVDHETVRINMTRAAALVHLATRIGDLELDAHDYSDVK